MVTVGRGVLDISDKQARAIQVVRDGTVVKTPVVDADQVDFLISKLPTAIRVDIPRVISQSPEAGTFVKKGTKVNLVMAPPNAVPIGVFNETLVALKEQPITVLEQVLKDPKVHEVLQTFTDPADVPADKQLAVRDAVRQKLNVSISEGNAPGQDFAAAFNTLMAGLACQ
jgi:hypothetical protein